MGQNSLYCRTDSTAHHFISQQIKIYKWRANPNCNARLPKVTITNALSYQQQQKYMQFMMSHSQKQSIKMAQLKSELEFTPELASEQVVVFQTYVGSLQKVKNSLNLQETLYCLTELLFGFQQIKKMYSQIIVRSSCCFLTKQGQIRSWINQNPKSNKVTPESESSLLGERQYKLIISKILDIAFQSSNKTADICNLFAMLRKSLEQTAKRSQSFCYIRSIIDSFQTQNRLSPKNLKGCLMRMQEAKQFEIKNSKLQQLKIAQPQYKPIMHKSLHSKIYNNQIKTSNIQFNKFQSHQSKYSQNSYLTKPSFAYSNCFDPSKYPNYAYIFQPAIPSSVSFEQNRPSSKPRKQSLNTTVRLSQALQKSEKPVKEINKTNTSYKEADSSPPRIPSQSSISQSLKISISNFSNQPKAKQHNSDLNNKNSKNKHMIKISNQSVVPENIKCQIQQQKAKKNTEVKYESMRNVNQSLEVPRPWITTKTITRLISDSPNSSLAHSEGTSESKASSQLYSGVLTQLARYSSQNKESITSVNEI